MPKYKIGFSWPMGNGQHETEEVTVNVRNKDDADKECEQILWDMITDAGLCTWWEKVEE